MFSDKWYGTKTEHLFILNRLDKKFVQAGYFRVLRAELQPIRIKPSSASEQRMDPLNQVVQLRTYLLLHSNGSMVVSVLLELENEPTSMQEVLGLAMIGLEDTLMDFDFGSDSPTVGWKSSAVDATQLKNISLQTYVNRVLTPKLGRVILRRQAKDVSRSVHSPGQYTLNVMIDSSPRCEHINLFSNQFGAELKALSDMDIVGFTRSSERVRERFSKNYSIDSELGVFLGHRAGTIIFQWPQIANWFSYALSRYHQRPTGKLALALEVYQHYAVFVEWLLIEESSIRASVEQLNSFIHHTFGSAKGILSKKRQMVQELEEFRDALTSFEHGARIIIAVSKLRGVDQLQKRFEQKRTIVQEIIVDRENLRLQSLMTILNVVLLASLFLALTDLPVQYYKIVPGSNHWLIIKGFALLLIPLIITTYYLRTAIARIWLARNWIGTLFRWIRESVNSAWLSGRFFSNRKRDHY